MLDTGHVEDSIFFSSIADQRLTYALESVNDLTGVKFSHQPTTIVISLPKKMVEQWADTEQVGVYSDWDIGSHGKLALVVEKDFACLDLSDSVNADTFPHPTTDGIC